MKHFNLPARQIPFWTFWSRAASGLGSRLLHISLIRFPFRGVREKNTESSQYLLPTFFGQHPRCRWSTCPSNHDRCDPNPFLAASAFPVPDMTYYKYEEDITKSTSAVFDEIHKPGEITPHSGIYKCEGCGDRIASNVGNPLPPQNHHQHSAAQGSIRWRMIVWA